MSQQPLTYNQANAAVKPLLSSASFDQVSPDATQEGYAQYAKPPYVFAAVPIIIAALLFYMKPSIITELDPKFPEGEPVISYKKLLIFDVVLSGMIIGAYYYYYKSNETKAA